MFDRISANAVRIRVAAILTCSSRSTINAASPQLGMLIL